MTPKVQRYTLIFNWLLILSLLLASCRNGVATPTSTSTPVRVTPTQSPPTLTPTPFQPPTPVPLAARVNGEAITLAEYQAELDRFQASAAGAGTNLATDGKKRVLDDLIDQVLLAQAAQKAGFVVDDALLQARLDRLTAQVGGAMALANWIAKHGYTDQEFRQAIARAIAAAWMRDQITAAVPGMAEQVHARQILLYNSDQANQVFTQLQSGVDFASLAAKFDPLRAGDLGWFPRGYLTEPALEETAFTLQPGQYSSVIKTRMGYHILQVIERDTQRPLTPDARLVLQTQALHQWLAERRRQSDIQIMLP
jgi:parvulin-like peptidyl-prolyl isomerase